MKNNGVHHYTTPTHLVWEGVGSEVVILDTTSHTTHHLTGALAEAFTAAATGQAVDTQEVVALVQRGFLEPRSPITRRHLVAGGVAGLGLTITSLSLPTVAMASSTQPKPTITAFVFDAAFGNWRWQQVMTTLRIFQDTSGAGLKETDIFVSGDTWTLTLINADGIQATGVVQGPPGFDLTLPFDFPNVAGGSYPSTSTAQLSRDTGTEILQSQEFNIIQF